jgi:hypothetical protein
LDRYTLTALQPRAPLQSWPDFLQGSRLWQGSALVLRRKETTMGLNDHIDDGRGPSPPIYIDGIIAMLKKEGWIEDKTFIPWSGTGGSQDGVCRFTKAGEGHDVEIIRYYPKSESSYYEAVFVPKMR